MLKNRKTWVQPWLVVLVRSKPEEWILTACKNGTAVGAQYKWHPSWCVLTLADGTCGGCFSLLTTS